MKKVLAVFITFAVAAPLLAQAKSRYIIALRNKPAVTGLRLVRDVTEATSHDVKRFRTVNLVAADLSDAEVATLRKSSEVRYVSRVIPRYLDTTEQPVPSHLRQPATNGRYSHSQAVGYGIDLVHARAVWPYSKGGGNSQVNVAIIDTGIDYTHPDLKANYQGGYNVFTKTNDPLDDHGHGTHTAGTIAAADNNFGVVGVAPEVKIWSVKVLQANGSGTDESVADGIDWVIQKKAEIGGHWIASLSLGASAPSDPEREIFERAIDDDILVVAAAGNTSAMGIQYPGAYDRVLAISAIDSNKKLASFSTWGPGIAFAAPGVDVLSTYRVGMVKLAGIDTGSKILASAMPLNGSAFGDVTADTVFAGIGNPEEFPSNTKGKIAIIRRGTLQFRIKVKNALTAGAIAVVIVPAENDDSANTRSNWTLVVDPDDATFNWPVVVSSSLEDGKALIDNAGKTPLSVSYATDDYAFMSGTSMATPHVAGVAALAWSLAPNATADDIKLGLKMTGADLGDKFYDDKFGYGLIDALAGAKYVAPATFGLPPTPPLVPTRRRAASPHH